MAFCKNCGAQLADGNVFCASCGAAVSGDAQTNTQGTAPNNSQPGYQQYSVPSAIPDPTDHTGEFSPADISNNKVIAMAPYLLSVFGLIVALLAAPQSPYVAFHARQALKITVLEALIGIAIAVLFWTIIVPFAGLVCLVILLVVNIICFFNVCAGKAKEPPIVSSFTFLK